MREYRTSIYCRARSPVRPTYGRMSLLQIMRAERKRDAIQEAVDAIDYDAILYGTGFGLAHVSRSSVLSKPA